MKLATPLLSLLLSIGWILPLTSAIAQPMNPERIERGNLVIEGIPEIPPRIEQRLTQYGNVRAASLKGWLPGQAGVLISTRFGETSQLHIVEQPGGARQQITFFEEPVQSVAINPNPARNQFLFTKDTGGSEFYQLFLFDIETGEYRQLTDGKARNGGALWSNRGDRFAFFTTQRNGRDWDVHIATANAPKRSIPVVEREGVWWPADWSADDTQLLIGRYVSRNESYLYQLDIKTQELTQVNPTDQPIAYDGAVFAKDGLGVYFTSDQGSEFQRLQYYDLASGEIQVFTEDIPWDIESFTLSENGQFLAFTANEEGISQLYLLDLASGQRRVLPDLPIGAIYGMEFSPDGQQLGMVFNTPKTTGDVYVLDLQSQELARWTYSEIGGLNSEKFVTPSLIRYPTFDRVNGKPRTIPAFYYRPPGKGPFPVLVNIHGGPESQSRPYFSPTTQYYLNELGIAVLLPNVRGSSGYGKSYLLLDNGRKREDSVKDIGALLDWIEQQPELDASRVAVSGGSYGGYMVLASMIHYNERLRAGINVVGISNFVTFLENTEAYRQDLRRVEYGDERDPQMREFLLSISPTTRAEEITKPLFVVQGLNDPRVPASESEQIVQRMRENSGMVWYLLAKDEGHGFSKKGNRDYLRNTVVLFLEQFLLTEP